MSKHCPSEYEAWPGFPDTPKPEYPIKPLTPLEKKFSVFLYFLFTFAGGVIVGMAWMQHLLKVK